MPASGPLRVPCEALGRILLGSPVSSGGHQSSASLTCGCAAPASASVTEGSAKEKAPEVELWEQQVPSFAR